MSVVGRVAWEPGYGEPRRRKDGRCAREGCRKRLKPPSARQKGVDPAMYALEPFCSTICCRAYFGIVDTRISSSDGRGGNP